MAERDNENKVVVVIPLYKEQPSEMELFSYKRAIEVFLLRKIILACPGNMNLDNYIMKENVSIIRFPASKFKSLMHYNRLLLTKYFYSKFIEYDYILIYQIDAYVFKDELSLWCNKNYDYIGAPWTIDYDPQGMKGFVNETGNGGFSLRKVKSFLAVHNSKKLIYDSNHFIIKYKLKTRLLLVLCAPFLFLKKIGFRNRISFFLKNYKMGEDKFWAFEAKKFQFSFRVASFNESLGFSFEMAPRILFKLNNYNLPFGCHAFEKHDFDFWKEFIK